MILPGTDVKTTCRIIEYADNIDIPMGTVGMVSHMQNDALTHAPMFVVYFHGRGYIGCFLNEVETVTPVIKGEWV